MPDDLDAVNEDAVRGPATVRCGVITRMSDRRAQSLHGLVAVVALLALGLQLVLVVSGSAVLVEDAAAPSTSVRVLRFFVYFTVQSNILVLATAASLAARPGRDGRIRRIVRLDAIVGITVTGLVHWFFLRPLLHLQGWSWVADRLLHLVVPLLAVAAWLLVGPRNRIDRSTVYGALAWPAAYLVLTLAHGAITGFYPYPFTDVAVHGYARVLTNAVAVAVLFLGLALAVRTLDRRLERPPP